MHKKRGFTLIELIIVIVIIAVLAAIVAPAMVSQTGKARQSEAVAALGALRTAAKLYYAENGDVWPTTMPQLQLYVPIAELDGPNYDNAKYTMATAPNINVAVGNNSAPICWMNYRNGYICTKP